MLYVAVFVSVLLFLAVSSALPKSHNYTHAHKMGDYLFWSAAAQKWRFCFMFQFRCSFLLLPFLPSFNRYVI